MCNLCTPWPIHRSTYRPTLDRYVGRHIDRHSTDISTEICRSERQINFNRTNRVLRAEHCNLRKTYDTIPLQWYKKVNFHPDSISPPLQRTLSFPIFDKFAMVFGYCLWRSTSLHLFDQPPTRNRRRYRHQQAKWIHWTSYRKFLTEGFRRTIRSECLDSLSLSCHTPLTPTAAMLSVYKEKMPSGGFNCSSDMSYMVHNQPRGLSGPLIACVADVERGKGIGKKGKREGGRGERGREKLPSLSPLSCFSPSPSPSPFCACHAPRRLVHSLKPRF